MVRLVRVRLPRTQHTTLRIDSCQEKMVEAYLQRKLHLNKQKSNSSERCVTLTDHPCRGQEEDRPLSAAPLVSFYCCQQPHAPLVLSGTDRFGDLDWSYTPCCNHIQCLLNHRT